MQADGYPSVVDMRRGTLAVVLTAARAYPAQFLRERKMMDITYAIAGNLQKRLVDMGDDTVAEIAMLPAILPTPWTPATAFNARLYADIEIQILATPTSAYIFQDSFDGINFIDCLLLDKSGSSLTAATGVGRYRLPGNCYLKARTGAGSTIFIRAGS